MSVAMVLGAVLGGCAGSTDSTADKLRRAWDLAEAAPYRVWSSGSHTVFVGPKVEVIQSEGRVTNWAGSRVEIIWDPAGRCYRRSTTVNRADNQELRQSARPVAEHPRVLSRHGARVVHFTVSGGTDGAGEEYEVQLDSRGRPALTWERSRRYFAIPASSWRRTKFSYPTRSAFGAALPRRPSPSCAIRYLGWRERRITERGTN